VVIYDHLHNLVGSTSTPNYLYKRELKKCLTGSDLSANITDTKNRDGWRDNIKSAF
jgi:hypothetical protein